ncbi:ABC transporter permease [Neobacillus sp. PS3-40]|uniref:ABC transporter permease n=1 Tax=Neobacillus sp. PS3-40 TaxID=3070679 RepID=UPI0027DEE628|nr:ABC transporter permease [Neobacillus sp. PS3-40]WML46164.1 ABC transporter permease [Neobacillus sp. PS3-40]
MNILDSIQISIDSLMSHKLKSLLTMLGIIIGVASVITVVSIGQGGEAKLKNQFSGLGNNSLDIYYEPGKNEIKNSTATVELFTAEDVYELSKISEIKKVISSNDNVSKIFFNEKAQDGRVISYTDGYYDITPVELIEGRLIDHSDLQEGRKVAVITKELKERLFHDKDPINEIIEVEGTPLQIIGVYKDKTSTIIDYEKRKILVPMSIWPFLYGNDKIQMISIQAKSADTLNTAGKNAVDFLNHSKDVEGKYKVLNIKMISKNASTITDIMTAVISAIAGISLLVGGIGVMNIMLVSVTERTREIGIRKSIGATPNKILLQILIESVILTILGGVIGIVFGIGNAYIISYFTNFPSIISLPVIFGGLAFSVIIGVVFGILPANKAARLDPIEALRFE